MQRVEEAWNVARDLIFDDSFVEVERVLLSLALMFAGIAGCVAKTAIAPLDRVKILYQIASPHYPYVGVWTTLKSIVHREGAYHYTCTSMLHRLNDLGLLALFKGNGSTVIRIFPYASIQFFCYDYYYAVRHNIQLID